MFLVLFSNKFSRYRHSDKCLLLDNDHLLSYVTHAVKFFSCNSYLKYFQIMIFFPFLVYNQVQQILGSSKSGDFQFVWFPMRSVSCIETCQPPPVCPIYVLVCRILAWIFSFGAGNRFFNCIIFGCQNIWLLKL